MILKESVTVCLLFGGAVLFARLIGAYMARVFTVEKTKPDFLQPVENIIYRFCRINPSREMDWKQCLVAMLAINAVWLIWGFSLLLFQGSLFLNPAGNPSMEWHLAVNAAISFLTSANLQHYSGETGATYLSQIAVFTFLQFVSAATSLAAGVAVVRGLSSGNGTKLGNFYSDLTKSCIRILLPLCIVAAILFMLRGVPITFEGPQKIGTLQGDQVTVATGPVAAMLPIKELGSNGGGFFGANDAHPFENPDFFTFSLHTLIVFLLPMAFVFFIGDHLGSRRFGRMLFCVMTVGFLLVTIPIILQEAGGNPAVRAMGIDQSAGNMEGKETRFGSVYSAFYSGENMVIPAGTTVGVHDSYMPLSGVYMLVGMQIDGFFGGLGTGWINMFLYVLIAVFIGTLMIGRTPELFGKKIGIFEMKIAGAVSVAALLVPLGLAALANFVYVNYPGGGGSLGWLTNKKYHGFTTFLYEYISSVAGNGSEFSGLGNNTPFWNLTTSFAMLSGRFIPIIGGLRIAGALKEKKYTPLSSGSLRADSLTFGTFLFIVIILLNALSLLPALMLGPLAEYFSRS